MPALKREGSGARAHAEHTCLRRLLSTSSPPPAARAARRRAADRPRAATTRGDAAAARSGDAVSMARRAQHRAGAARAIFILKSTSSTAVLKYFEVEFCTVHVHRVLAHAEIVVEGNLPNQFDITDSNTLASTCNHTSNRSTGVILNVLYLVLHVFFM